MESFEIPEGIEGEKYLLAGRFGTQHAVRNIIAFGHRGMW